MKECPWCKSFKKASNCIQCYMSEKKRNEELIKDIRRIANDTPYLRTQEKLLEYLEKISGAGENA